MAYVRTFNMFHSVTDVITARTCSIRKSSNVHKFVIILCLLDPCIIDNELIVLL